MAHAGPCPPSLQKGIGAGSVSNVPVDFGQIPQRLVPNHAPLRPVRLGTRKAYARPSDVAVMAKGTETPCPAVA